MLVESWENMEQTKTEVVQGASCALEEARPEIEDRFAWLTRRMPVFMPAVRDDAEVRDAFRDFVEGLAQAGMIDNLAELLDVARVFLAETISMRAASIVTKYLMRLEDYKGTFDGSHGFTLEKLMASFQRANKTAQEIKDSAAMSRRSRMEAGLGSQNALAQMLKRLQEEASKTSAPDVSGCLVQGRAKSVRDDGGQIDAQFEELAVDERPVTDEELEFLARREGAETGAA